MELTEKEWHIIQPMLPKLPTRKAWETLAWES